MAKYLFVLFLTINLSAQVGINTDSPQSSLQIDSKDKLNPESTAGLSVPIYNAFPAENPSEAQNGMLVYLNNSNPSYAGGFYFWNSSVNNWEYIVDFSSQELDLSKIQGVATRFSPSNISGTGTQSRTIPFDNISSVDPSFILENGGIKIGKTSTYYLQLTGGVFKTASNVVNDYTAQILINGQVNNLLVSTNSAPGGANLGRSTVFYISSVIELSKNDVLTIRLTRSTTGTNTVTIDTPFNLTLSKLD